jgi:hypothetical protein
VFDDDRGTVRAAAPEEHHFRPGGLAGSELLGFASNVRRCRLISISSRW